MPRIRHPKDFWSGVAFLAFAAFFITGALEHSIGTAFRMGPAYFPLVLAGLLAVIGAMTLFGGLVTDGEAPTGFRPLAILLIVASVVLFGLTIRLLGLIVAVPLVVVISAAASIHFRPVAVVLLAVGLTAFAVLVFAYGLGLPLPVVGPWLAG